MSARPLGLNPSKIIAVHLNYPSRAAERGRIPTHPSYFSNRHRRCPVAVATLSAQLRKRGLPHMSIDGVRLRFGSTAKP